MPTTWTVERTASRRFPYRISLATEEKPLFAVRAQSLWPGPGQQIFCVRERLLDPAEALEPIERVPVAHYTRVGRKLTVALDRPTRKRCEFLTLRKPYAGREGQYEQVFFRTESGIRSHRSRTRLELSPAAKQLTIAVDSGEKYRWRFPGAELVRRKLVVGDYALIVNDEAAAVVERKSFENLLGDLGAMQALHHQLADLASWPVAALVVEAQLADFLDEKRLRSRWPPSFVARALAEITAMHPKLPVVFAGNRKLANVWTERFFQAVSSGRAAGGGAGAGAGAQLDLIEGEAGQVAPEPRGPGLDHEIRSAVLNGDRRSFAMAELAERFPGVPLARLKRVIDRLRVEGLVSREGAGRGARWRVTPIHKVAT
jgi:hypothetical protein